ncbi:MAG: RNA polymerase sigma factor [Clostridia bacterium]|nr:RNA polymerase sigma factor [Clostridia bacterium]
MNVICFSQVLESLETEEERTTAAEIFELHQNMMYHTAFDVLRNREDAEDAVADALVKICRNLDRFTERDEKSRKLLVQICVRNTAIDFYRKRKREEAVFVPDPMEDIPEEESGDQDDLGTMETYLAQLSEEHRAVLILKYVEEMKNTEIARLLGISQTTVGTRILRAKQRLRKITGKEGSHSEAE